MSYQFSCWDAGTFQLHGTNTLTSFEFVVLPHPDCPPVRPNDGIEGFPYRKALASDIQLAGEGVLSGIG